MNKDFKNILILGVISIIISAIGLYQFKDIKFKNTKELQRKNEEKQEQLINQYNELVDVYIPNITDKLPENDLPTTGYITLIIPGFMENKGFYTISSNLDKEEIKLSIKKIDSYSQYKSEIKSNLQNYDIALIPTNRILGLDTETINLGENIKPYFIDIFNETLDNTQNIMIPFSIDPAITLYKKGIFEQKSRKELLSYIVMRKTENKYTMPILRGFDDLSLKLFESNSTPFEFFTELLVLHLKQIKESSDNQELSNMININNISLKNKYTYQNLKTITTLLSKKSEYCDNYPAICIAKFGYSDITFGFFSDIDILEKYFPGENNLIIGDFTNTDKSYPVKGRVFVVPRGNQNTNITNKFFSEYISESISGNSDFRNNTLSSITNIYENQKSEEKFQNIIKNEDKFYIFMNNINLQETMANDGKTINMLKGNYDTNSYISSLQY